MQRFLKSLSLSDIEKLVEELENESNKISFLTF